ncbi:hypothetical protein BpHYR1_039431 [Brachionus plicatilis]|uniref:Uncharacterized protein n=1 Tax=Brachionus plicatilis TaxID=10195 RepID=A0A3M7T4S0_BRAPC|nr:hypothetical protein BpHYR1_039431 [Brachionus plicatilis]
MLSAWAHQVIINLGPSANICARIKRSKCNLPFNKIKNKLNSFLSNKKQFIPVNKKKKEGGNKSLI